MCPAVLSDYPNLYRLHSGSHFDALYRGKNISESVYLPFFSFVFPFYSGLIFNTLFLSSVNVTSPNRINRTEQHQWIAVELLNYRLALLYFSPFIEHLQFQFLTFPSLFLFVCPTAWLTLCVRVTEVETNKGYFWDEKSKLAVLDFCLPCSCQHENQVVTAGLPLEGDGHFAFVGHDFILRAETDVFFFFFSKSCRVLNNIQFTFWADSGNWELLYERQ